MKNKSYDETLRVLVHETKGNESSSKAKKNIEDAFLSNPGLYGELGSETEEQFNNRINYLEKEISKSRYRNSYNTTLNWFVAETKGNRRSKDVKNEVEINVFLREIDLYGESGNETEEQLEKRIIYLRTQAYELKAKNQQQRNSHIPSAPSVSVTNLTITTTKETSTVKIPSLVTLAELIDRYNEMLKYFLFETKGNRRSKDVKNDIEINVFHRNSELYGQSGIETEEQLKNRIKYLERQIINTRVEKTNNSNRISNNSTNLLHDDPLASSSLIKQIPKQNNVAKTAYRKEEDVPEEVPISQIDNFKSLKNEFGKGSNPTMYQFAYSLDQSIKSFNHAILKIREKPDSHRSSKEEDVLRKLYNHKGKVQEIAKEVEKLIEKEKRKIENGRGSVEALGEPIAIDIKFEHAAKKNNSKLLEHSTADFGPSIFIYEQEEKPKFSDRGEGVSYSSRNLKYNKRVGSESFTDEKLERKVKFSDEEILQAQKHKIAEISNSDSIEVSESVGKKYSFRGKFIYEQEVAFNKNKKQEGKELEQGEKKCFTARLNAERSKDSSSTPDF